MGPLGGQQGNHTCPQTTGALPWACALGNHFQQHQTESLGFFLFGPLGVLVFPLVSDTVRVNRNYGKETGVACM